MGGILRDLKAVSQDVPEEEQVLNVIRALPDTEHWQSFSLIMVHNKSIKTFEAISEDLKMEDEQ